MVFCFLIMLFIMFFCICLGVFIDREKLKAKEGVWINDLVMKGTKMSDLADQRMAELANARAQLRFLTPSAPQSCAPALSPVSCSRTPSPVSRSFALDEDQEYVFKFVFY